MTKYRGVSQAAGALAARLLHVARGVLRCGGAAAQALAGAEAAYTRALTAASRVALAGDCDGAALCAAAAGLADLPFQVGQQHAAIGAGLSDTTRAVQARGPPPGHPLCRPPVRGARAAAAAAVPACVSLTASAACSGTMCAASEPYTLTLYHSQRLHSGRAREPRAWAAQEVVAALRAGCADVTADAHRAHRAMDGARLELAAAHAARQAARRCRRARPAPWA